MRFFYRERSSLTSVTSDSSGMWLFDALSVQDLVKLFHYGHGVVGSAGAGFVERLRNYDNAQQYSLRDARLLWSRNFRPYFYLPLRVSSTASTTDRCLIYAPAVEKSIPFGFSFRSGSYPPSKGVSSSSADDRWPMNHRCERIRKTSGIGYKLRFVKGKASRNSIRTRTTGSWVVLVHMAVHLVYT